MSDESQKAAPVKRTRAQKVIDYAAFKASLPKDERTAAEIEAQAMKDQSYAKYRQKLTENGYKVLDEAASPAV